MDGLHARCNDRMQTLSCIDVITLIYSASLVSALLPADGGLPAQLLYVAESCAKMLPRPRLKLQARCVEAFC